MSFPTNIARYSPSRPLFANWRRRSATGDFFIFQILDLTSQVSADQLFLPRAIFYFFDRRAPQIPHRHQTFRSGDSQKAFFLWADKTPLGGVPPAMREHLNPPPFPEQEVLKSGKEER